MNNQIEWQKKVILEEYMEHIALQVKEQTNGKGTFVRTPHMVSGREQDGQNRAT